MSRVPEIAVKGCRFQFPCAFPGVGLVKSTGVTYRTSTATVEFHLLSLSLLVAVKLKPLRQADI